MPFDFSRLLCVSCWWSFCNRVAVKTSGESSPQDNTQQTEIYFSLAVCPIMLRSFYQPLSLSYSLPLRRLVQKLDRGRRFISPELKSQKASKNGEMRRSMAIVFGVATVVWRENGRACNRDGERQLGGTCGWGGIDSRVGENWLRGSTTMRDFQWEKKHSKLILDQPLSRDSAATMDPDITIFEMIIISAKGREVLSRFMQ